MNKKILPLVASLSFLTCLDSANAAITTTIDRPTGNWSLSVTEPLQYYQNQFFGNHQATWIAPTVTGNTATSSLSSFTYLGLTSTGTVSGAGSISVNYSDEVVYLVSLSFSSGLTAAGTFSSITITPDAPFPVNSSITNSPNGDLSAAFQTPTNGNMDVVFVPEPSSSLLLGLSILGVIARRKRS